MTDATPEAMKVDYGQRWLTYERIMELVADAQNHPTSVEKHSQICAAVLSIESERDRFAKALNTIALRATTCDQARDWAAEALSTTTTER